ncbi:MAG TPA: alpha/beta fold hydrolase, partial [Caulobacteraceae bacterium]
PVQIGHGDKALHGALVRPDGPTAPAAVLLIAGSGPSDRDGDDRKSGEHSRTLWFVAQALAERGVISLRYDKRGTGESAGAGDAATFGQTVEEAAAWARVLAHQPGVRCVVLLGHSEGALVATLVEHKVRLCGLVLASGASQNLGDLIEAQDALAHRSPELSARIREIIQAMRAGQAVGEVPKGYDSLFGPKAEGYTRSEIAIDPTAELAKVKVPVLVVQGDNDLQVKVEDARRLAAAAGVQPAIVPGMNHVLKLAPKTVTGNFMTYINPSLPLAPGVAEAITGFVLARR